MNLTVPSKIFFVSILICYNEILLIFTYKIMSSVSHNKALIFHNEHNKPATKVEQTCSHGDLQQFRSLLLTAAPSRDLCQLEK